MMRYNGIFAAVESSQPYTTAAVLIALQVPADTQIEIIRAWCSAASNDPPLDEMQEIELYVNDANSTGGAALTEFDVQGSDDVPSVTALGGSTAITQGATPDVIYPDIFHLQNGWLYLPVPEERIRRVGATASEVGLKLAQAPNTSSTISYGMIWGEVG